jgi:hypothetical protein
MLLAASSAKPLSLITWPFHIEFGRTIPSFRGAAKAASPESMLRSVGNMDSGLAAFGRAPE